jgi:hypothetical protein
MPQTTPTGPGGPQLPGGIRHQLVLWLNQVGVPQPLLEQLHLRQVVSAALEAVHGEETTIVESGRLVEVLVLNRLMPPRPLYRVGEWLQGRVLATAWAWTPPRSTTLAWDACSRPAMG